MALAKFKKTPNETKRYSIDYIDWLDTGEYLSTVIITATPSVATNPILVDVDLVQQGATAFSFLFSGGDTDITYKLLVRATTSASQVKEDVVAIEVKTL